MPEIQRIYHTWDKWECYPAGFYEEHPPKGMEVEDCERKYKEMLQDLPLFGRILAKVIAEWKHSCEHYLTNERMNRIAWLGQAAAAYQYKIPSRFRGGFNLLSEEEQEAANQKALLYLNKWMKSQGYPQLTMEEAQSKTQMDLY